MSDNDDRIGFKAYEWKGKPIITDDRCESQKMYYLDPSNIIYTPQERKPTPWRKKMWNCIKGAWSLLLRGDDYHE